MKQQYDSYKPSGIDWIGDIPSHWTIMPIKHLCRSEKYAVKTGPFGSQLKGEDLRENGDIRVYNQRNVIDNNFSDVTSFVTLEKAKELDSFYTRPNDLLITSRGTIGKSAILPCSVEMGILHPCLIALRIDISEANLKWVQRWINDSEAFRIEVVSKSNATTIDVIYTETIKNIRLALPPIAEQEAIVAWLDKKCEEIDAAIAKVDREIELIDELKQSEISRVVTRGLNPDVSLRPSGIDWIGDIPEHWTKCRLKFIGSARNGLTYSPSDVKDSGKLVIRSSNIQDAKLNYDDSVFVANYPETLSVNSGDTIICSRNGSINLIGKSVFIENDMDVTFGAFMMRFRPYEHPKYSHYLLSIAISRYKGLFATTTINQLTADSLGKMEAVMPPYMEQVQIADYLDKKCAEIDGLKAKLTKKRDTLTELRQSIISEVVTGKRKVI
jgi:type I restriction enzyme, S subunit